MARVAKVGGSSPWGRIETVTEITSGAWWVSTASHGGLKLSARLNRLVHKLFRRVGGWYEEDCQWARVAVTFPSLFTGEQVSAAQASLKNWEPRSYEAVTGIKVSPEESLVLRRQLAAEKYHGYWVAKAAMGSWHPSVPAGMVAVICRQVGATIAWERTWLVPEKEYENSANRCELGFIAAAPDGSSRFQGVA